MNMLALLAYSLLERQAQQSGLQMTIRRIIAKLQNLNVVETFCWDGSYLIRLVPIDEDRGGLLQTLAQMLADLRLPPWLHLLLGSAGLGPYLHQGVEKGRNLHRPGLPERKRCVQRQGSSPPALNTRHGGLRMAPHYHLLGMESTIQPTCKD